MEYNFQAIDRGHTNGIGQSADSDISIKTLVPRKKNKKKLLFLVMPRQLEVNCGLTNIKLMSDIYSILLCGSKENKMVWEFTLLISLHLIFFVSCNILGIGVC